MRDCKLSVFCFYMKGSCSLCKVSRMLGRVVASSHYYKKILSVFDNQVLWSKCFPSTICVGLCALQLHPMGPKCGTTLSFALLLMMAGAPSYMLNGQNN